jgi:nitrite reductase/ring-hydroxylating ferredoxin subunit
MFVPALKESEIAVGGMKAVTVKDKQIVIANTGKGFLAFDRRCGHMNAPLEMGTMDSHYVTCPLHMVRFDARTGEALNRPVPREFGEKLPPRNAQHTRYIREITAHIRTCDIRTYKTKVEGGILFVDI